MCPHLYSTVHKLWLKHRIDALSSAVQWSYDDLHCKEDPIYVFPGMKLHGFVPNSYIHVSVSDLYIPTSGPPILPHLGVCTQCPPWPPAECRCTLSAPSRPHLSGTWDEIRAWFIFKIFLFHVCMISSDWHAIFKRVIFYFTSIKHKFNFLFVNKFNFKIFIFPDKKNI